MEQRLNVAVWLKDEWARLIVGAPPAKTPSRWATQGEIVEEVAVGLWLKTDTIKEFRPGAEEFRPGAGRMKQVDWMFKSSQLLIRWEAIVTIQAFEGDDKEIGFKPSA